MEEISAEVQVCGRPLTDFWYNMVGFRRARYGQALLEYVLSLACLLVVVGILWVLVRVAVHHAERTERLVQTDCP